MMWRIWWAVISCGAAQFAAAEESLKLLPSPLDLPRHIGPMSTDGAAQTFGDPRLGVSYQYEGRGLLLTVYVYDGGVEGIPDGAENTPVCQQFEEAKAGVNQAGYREVVLEKEQLVRLAPPDDAPLAREALYEMVRDGHPTISYVWVTGVAKLFVKLRFSLDAGLRDEVTDARRAILDALGTAIKPHLVPLDPKAEKSGKSIQVVVNKGGKEEMGASLVYLMMLTGLVEKQLPGPLPVCGGEVIPDFETELAAYRGVIQVNREGAKSEFGKLLVELDGAGFLEEFTWTDMHREEWGATPPDGLTLADYASWRKKHLKRFQRPIFGHVILNDPRPMPVEAPDAP